jgi:ATP-dependent Lon protease
MSNLSSESESESSETSSNISEEKEYELRNKTKNLKRKRKNSDNYNKIYEKVYKKLFGKVFGKGYEKGYDKGYDKGYMDGYNEDDEEYDEDYEEEINDDKKECEIINVKDIKENPNIQNYKREDYKYYISLSNNKKRKINNIEKKINSINCSNIPLRFKVLNSNLSDKIKAIAISKLKNVSPLSSDSVKAQNYVENLCKIPIGIYKSLKVNAKDNKNVEKAILNFYNILNKNVYGHENTKDQLIRIIAQWIVNPTLKGNIIGIQGVPGSGKTHIMKNGLSKALNIPFCFIPLGGVEDSSYLTGHSYTYEGSIWGKIVDSLLKAECMNPIFYFDELDKVSDSRKGQEIINTLIHITDQTQNDHFVDKYFNDISLDISKSLIIFTYNNENLINPILRDRMIKIYVEGYKNNDKLVIAKNYLIPDLFKDFNFEKNELEFDDNILEYLIEKIEKEEGVRNLKRGLEKIISNMNLYKLLKKSKNSKELNLSEKIIVKKLIEKNIKYILPVKINKDIIDIIFGDNKDNDENSSFKMMYI